MAFRGKFKIAFLLPLPYIRSPNTFTFSQQFRFFPRTAQHSFQSGLFVSNVPSNKAYRSPFLHPLLGKGTIFSHTLP